MLHREIAMMLAMLSNRTILALEDELQRIERQKRALEQLLDDARADVETPEDRPGEDGQSRFFDSSYSNSSFAAKVRSALAQFGRVANSSDVAEQMIKNGTPELKDGKSLRQRVAVELFRAAKRNIGGVRKVSRGRYRAQNN